jgi:hypothetical protein
MRFLKNPSSFPPNRYKKSQLPTTFIVIGGFIAKMNPATDPMVIQIVIPCITP